MAGFTVNIYNNNGTEVIATYSNVTYLSGVTSTGINGLTDTATWSYTYNREHKFFGISDSAESVVPKYAVGFDELTEITDNTNFYLVEVDKVVTGVGIEALRDWVKARPLNSHASSHGKNGADPITIDESQVSGLTSKFSNLNTQLGTMTDAINVRATIQQLNAVEAKIPTVDYPVTDVKVNGVSKVADKVASFTVPTQASDIGAVSTSDSRLTDSRTPLSHASTHAKGGTDEIEVDMSQVDGLETALNGKASSDSVTAINGKIPAQASSTNQLADKAFVNSTLQTSTSNFRGNWDNWASVPTDSNLYPVDYLGVKVPSVNDYMVVQNASDYTAEELTGTWRFKYSGVWSTDGKNGWHPEYQVNEEPFTAEQVAVLASGITSAKRQSYDDHLTASNPHGITKSTVGLGNVENKSSATIRGEITSANITTALGFTPANATSVPSKGTIADGNTGYVTGGDVYTVLGNLANQINSL